jgi:hypothetical protein
MLNISANFRVISNAYLLHKKVEPGRAEKTLEAFDELGTKQLPKPTSGKQIFVNSNEGGVLINLGTTALGESASTDERLNLGKCLVEFYYRDLNGELSLADVSENLMY